MGRDLTGVTGTSQGLQDITGIAGILQGEPDSPTECLTAFSLMILSQSMLVALSTSDPAVTSSLHLL